MERNSGVTGGVFSLKRAVLLKNSSNNTGKIEMQEAKISPWIASNSTEYLCSRRGDLRLLLIPEILLMLFIFKNKLYVRCRKRIQRSPEAWRLRLSHKVYVNTTTLKNTTTLNQQCRSWVDVAKGMADEASLWHKANPAIPALQFRREGVFSSR
uniref:Uncharacterized protein n=1 Tax=Oryza sativa subsp. japonica TaxID=39947 RepID=Q6Z0W9_ORYSJ|nr:hypothetical protein [Oryza sativa Japonica Group]